MITTLVSWLLLSLLLSSAMGLLLIASFLPWRLLVRRWLLACSLAVGYGIGLSSCSLFIWLTTKDSSDYLYILLELVVLGALLWISWTTANKERREGAEGSVFETKVESSRISRILSIPFSVLLLTTVLAFLMLSLSHPHGGVDAWGIWNMRARFIFRGGQEWIRACSPLLTNPDYPLLLSGFVARCWSYMGQDAAAAPVAVAALFSFGTLGLLSSSLAVLRSRSQALLGGSVLLATSLFVNYSTSQYADVPISFFFLATFVLLALANRSTEKRRLIALAGMGAAISAWTKNEGILFVLVVLTVRFLFLLRHKRSTWSRDVIPFMAGLLPVAVLIVHFKIALAPPNYIFSPQTIDSVLAKFTDLARYQLIAKTFASSLYEHFGEVLPVLLVYAVLMGRVSRHNGSSVASQIICTMLLMFAGYFVIYVISPLDLAFHLGSSVHRLFLQLWPSFLFAYFLTVSSPEERLKCTAPRPIAERSDST